jgi:hypothetical protein
VLIWIICIIWRNCRGSVSAGQGCRRGDHGGHHLLPTLFQLLAQDLRLLFVLTDLVPVESVWARPVVHPGELVEAAVQSDGTFRTSGRVCVIQQWLLAMEKRWHERIWIPFQRVSGQIPHCLVRSLRFRLILNCPLKLSRQVHTKASSSHHRVGPGAHWQGLRRLENSSVPLGHVLKQVQVVDVALLANGSLEQIAIAGLLQVPHGTILNESFVRDTKLHLVSVVHIWSSDGMYAVLVLENTLLVEGGEEADLLCHLAKLELFSFAPLFLNLLSLNVVFFFHLVKFVFLIFEG